MFQMIGWGIVGFFVVSVLIYIYDSEKRHGDAVDRLINDRLESNKYHHELLKQYRSKLLEALDVASKALEAAKLWEKKYEELRAKTSKKKTYGKKV